jgi:hypothetical protein
MMSGSRLSQSKNQSRNNNLLVSSTVETPLLLLFILNTQAVPTNSQVKGLMACRHKLHNIKSPKAFSFSVKTRHAAP